MIDWDISEKNFQELIVSLARNSGWLVYHTYDSRRSAPGFPDLVMVKGKRLAFVELKTKSARETADQRNWLDRLIYAGRAEVYLWRPQDWSIIVDYLHQED